jgi:MinD-like ATPase involved in chromosome partitioning or flagellar assembly
MARLAEQQIPVAAVYDVADDPHGTELAKIQACGVSTVEPESLGDLMVTISRRTPVIARGGHAAPADAPVSDGSTAQQAQTVGTTIAIGGPGGAGVTEIAVGLAHAMSDRFRTILVDVDEMRPSVARRLGLGLAPHIVTATEEIGHLGTSMPVATVRQRVDAVLAQPAVANPNGLPFDVISGLPTSTDWPSMSVEGVENVIIALRRVYDVVILRVGPSLEDMSRWVDRFAVSRMAAATSDRIVSVADGSPTGIAESLDWLADLHELRTTGIDLVVNRVPSGRFRRAELTEVLTAAVGEDAVSTVSSVRFDKALPDRSWAGALATRGPSTKDIAALARLIAPQTRAKPEPPLPVRKPTADNEVIDFTAKGSLPPPPPPGSNGGTPAGLTPAEAADGTTLEARP